jgi:hypothetical protein
MKPMHRMSTRSDARVISVAIVLALIVGRPVAGQHVTGIASYALASYAEQGGQLSFGGSGPAGEIDVSLGRFGGYGVWERLAMSPTHTGPAFQAFTMTDVDAGVRYRIAGGVSADVGYVARHVSQTNAAEAFVGGRVGARAAFPLAPGAEVDARAGYVLAGSFSAGGRAPFGLDVGLGFAYGPGSGRVQVVGDYGFERIDRRTTQGGTDYFVPIASSVGRLGLAVRL